MRHVCSVVVGLLIGTSWYGVASAVPPTEPAPETSTTAPPVTIGPEVPVLQVPPPIADPNVASTPLVAIPAGCTAPPPPVAVFVGTLADADATTARFAVEQIRAGSLDGYAVNTIVDVRYDDDIRYLRAGQQYLVGAKPNALTHVLESKVRLPALLFGGDAVIGVDDTDVRCPRTEDGVKTLLVDGTEVDTGVLTPLKTAKKSLLMAILKPLGIAFAILVALASIKLLIFAMVRAAREPPEEDGSIPYEGQRDREHIDAELNSR